MITVTMLLTVCSLSTGRCRDVPAPEATPSSFFACAGAEGQEQAAKWAAEHPGYRVQAVRCTIGSMRPERAA